MRGLAEDDDRNITLFYCVQEKSQALFLDEFIENFSTSPNRKLIVLESNKKEFATLDRIKEAISFDLSQAEYFLCEPKIMVTGVKKSLKAAGVATRQIHNEMFEFR